MYPCWIDHTDAALAEVAGVPADSLTDADRYDAVSALNLAVDILHGLTGKMFHGPGVATDEYLIHNSFRRLSTSFRPVREVLSLNIDGKPTTDFYLVGGLIYSDRAFYCHKSSRMARVTYRFGSTLTAGARSTAIYYAQQFYRAGREEDCDLPERVVSINREGISMSLVDPQNFLERGRTGVVRIDQWLASLSKRTGARMSGVFDTQAPPPSNVAVECG